MAITLSPETTKQLIASIKRYAAAQLDEEIGELKAAAARLLPEGDRPEGRVHLLEGVKTLT